MYYVLYNYDSFPCFDSYVVLSGVCESTSFIKVQVKVKQSHYRPGQDQRVLRKLRFPDYMTTE